MNEKRKKQIKLSLIVTLLAIPLTAIFTNPLLAQMQSHIAGYFGADAINHAWSVWWFKQAVSTLQQSPADLNYIYYPAEVTHPIILATAWVKLVGYAFIGQVSPIILYNLHLFLSYPLTWVITTLLCYELTDSELGAIVGGAIFTFCMHRTAHALYGHFTHALAYSYPLLVLALWYQLKQPTWRRGGMLVVSLFIIMTTDLMAVAFFAGPIIVAMVWFGWDRENWLKTLWPFAVAMAFVLPFVWPLIASNVGGGLDWYGASGVGEFSADALALFVPPPEHLLSRVFPAVRSASEQIYWLGASESVVYAGWVALVLAGVGLVKVASRERWARFWFFISAGGIIFSLGPLLRVAGEFVQVRGVPIIMPYALLLQLPFMRWGRTPARLNMTVMLGIAVLAAFGVRWLGQRFSFSSKQMAGVGAVLLCLVVLDSVGPYPWPMTRVAVPAGFEVIAEDRRDVAVLDIPVDDYIGAKYHLLYQMEHGHALVGGFRVRLPALALEEMLVVEAFARPGGDLTELAEQGVGYVVLHKGFLDSELTSIEAFLSDELGEPFYEDEDVVLFAVPDVIEDAPTPFYKNSYER